MPTDTDRSETASRVDPCRTSWLKWDGSLVKSAWMPIVATLLVGCASSPEAERAAASHGLAADLILVGRFVSSEEMEVLHPMGDELSHVAEAWRIFTFETSSEPKEQLRFAGSSSKCPPEPLDDQTYVVALRKGFRLTSLETRSRGKRIGPPSRSVSRLLLIACSPVDAARSDGFIRP